MASMGYIAGTGLGKHGEGRLEPVTATVLPPGKSLGKYTALNLFAIFNFSLMWVSPSV